VQAFGISEEEIVKYVGNGIIRWGDLVTNILDDLELRINQTRNSETTSLVTVLLEGRSVGRSRALYHNTYCCLLLCDTVFSYNSFIIAQSVAGAFLFY